MAEVSVARAEVVQLHVVQSRLRQARSQAVWGPVWLSWSGHSFPGVEWDDIALDVVLGIAGHVFGTGVGTVEVRFPDGPFSLLIGPSAEGWLRLVMQNYAEGSREAELIADLNVFRESVRACMNLILDRCDREGWSGGRIDYLRQLVVRLDHGGKGNS